MDNDAQSAPGTTPEATQIPENNIETPQPLTAETEPTVEPQPTVTSQPAETSAPPKKSNKTIIIIVVIVAIILILIPLIILALPFLIIMFAVGAADTQANIKAATTDIDSISSALCKHKGHTILFQRPDIKDSAIIECDTTNFEYGKDIYSVTDEHEGKVGFSVKAHATYLGDAENVLLNKYLSEQKHLFRHGDEDTKAAVVLLVEADTEESAVDQVYEKLYDYLAEYNESYWYYSEMDIAIFYDDDLSEVKDAKDYLVLSSTVGLSKGFPYGNGFDDYFFELETTPENMNWLVEHTELYPSATTEAMKQNRHVLYEVQRKSKKNTDDFYYTKEEFRQLLLDSFTK